MNPKKKGNYKIVCAELPSGTKCRYFLQQHRLTCVKYILELSKIAKEIKVFSGGVSDRKYRQELKRGYYDSEKAKKYFP